MSAASQPALQPRSMMQQLKATATSQNPTIQMAVGYCVCADSRYERKPLGTRQTLACWLSRQRGNCSWHGGQEGYLSVVKYLLEYNFPAGVLDRMTDSAVVNGHPDVVELLRQKSCLWVALKWVLFTAAAEKGHLGVVRFVHEDRYEGCTKRAMDGAAVKGHLEVVAFLHENRAEGCNERAMDGAATNGHFSVKYLHEHRTEGWTPFSMDAAAMKGFLEIVKFLHANRTEGCSASAMSGAAQYDHMGVVQYLYEHRIEGVSLAEVPSVAAASHLDVMRFLCENYQAVCASDMVMKAAEQGDFEMLAFLHACCNESDCSVRAMETAAQCGQHEIV